MCGSATASFIGGDPQDLKYQGEETWVEVGEGTIIREYSTINRGTSATCKTTVGARLLHHDATSTWPTTATSATT